MLMSQVNGVLGMPHRAGRVFPWMISQVVPLLLRRADGQALVWTWRDDPELLVVLAHIQASGPEMRAARASMPMEYDDTETFDNPHLGRGEKLVVELPPQPNTPPFATYTWDQGTQLVMLSAVCGDRTRFGTVMPDLDALARTLRVVEDISLDGDGPVLRLGPG